MRPDWNGKHSQSLTAFLGDKGYRQLLALQGRESIGIRLDRIRQKEKLSVNGSLDRYIAPCSVSGACVEHSVLYT